MAKYSEPNYAVFSSWALDFCRAVNNRPLLVRWLFRQVIGRYAWREYVGLNNAFDECGMYPHWPYELQRQDYHNDGETMKNAHCRDYKSHDSPH